MAVCAICGTDLPHGARFCSNCGSAVAETPRGARERKLVTVLFVDVTGSTTLGERLDPERMREVMDAFFAGMRAEIEAEGGTVEKFIGDAVMAAFGVPYAHEDDPARALRAALHMLQRLEVVNQDLAKDYDVTLEVRIGVNTGEVLATTEPRPGESMVTGDAVNAASRLEAAAAPVSVPGSGGNSVDFGGGNPRDVDGHRHPQRQDSRMRRGDGHDQHGHHIVRRQAPGARRRRRAA